MFTQHQYDVTAIYSIVFSVFWRIWAYFSTAIQMPIITYYTVSSTTGTLAATVRTLHASRLRTSYILNLPLLIYFCSCTYSRSPPAPAIATWRTPTS
jgi:hypothetical protein